MFSSCSQDCDINFIQETSKIKLPDNYEVIDCYDNLEYVITAVFQVDSSGIGILLKENIFKKAPVNYKLDWFGFNYLDEDNRNIGNNDDLYFLEDCYKSNTWHFLLNTKTGMLWCSVLYPDWSGDFEPCEKDGEAVEESRFDFNLLNEFPYQTLEEYRISDTLDRTAKLNDNQFLIIFQISTTKPPKDRGECGCPIRSQIFKSNEYLLGNHGVITEDYDNLKFNFLTVLVENDIKQTIYWVSYANQDYSKRKDYPNFEKGELTNMYLSPVLAEKYKNDSVSYESYSKFLDKRIIKVTSVKRNLLNNRIDSMIQIFQLELYDMSAILDEAKYINGLCVLGFSDIELRKKYNY
jgi:hypothetical protein